MADVKLGGCWSGDAIAGYLASSRIPLRLAVFDGAGSPWVMSLWFLYDEGSLWCATNSGAKVLRYLADDTRCGFEVAGEQPPYRGVRGKGHADIIPERGGDILLRLLDRYGISRNSRLGRELLARIGNEVAIRITPSRITSWDFSTRMVDAQLSVES